MKRKVFLATLALGLTISAASLANAWMGSHGPYCNGPGMMMGAMAPTATPMGTTALTAEQQQQVAAIKAKYQGDLQAKQQAIQAKVAEIAAARTNPDTTVAELSSLRNELVGLQQEYHQLLLTANNEIATATGAPATSWGWGPHYCATWNDGSMATAGIGMMGMGTPGWCW